jgi:transient receptor potential cation channel subfamily V protein 5
MLSKGANHDLQDTNGCTVSHVLVVFDLMKMWDMAVECGAAINIENVFGLTPLTLAAYLARMDMFFHIASVEREIYWQLGKDTLVIMLDGLSFRMAKGVVKECR